MTAVQAAEEAEQAGEGAMESTEAGMGTTGSGADDTEVLERFFEEARPIIEELVTQAMHRGVPPARLAILLEKRFNGEIAGGCGTRASLGDKLAAVPHVDAAGRETILAAIERGPLGQIPLVLFVHGEGVVSVGIRHVAGGLAAVS